jgi:PilZ domain-containing protein
MRRVGDRRAAVRLEVVGALWGTLEFHKQARVRDLNQDGALLEYPVPVLPDSVHAVTFEHNGERVSLEVRVRHVRQASAPDGAAVYLAGVEFLSVPAALPELVAGLS